MLDAFLAAYPQHPDPTNSAQRVSFGTSGHRGSALAGSFNDAHIAAIVQAVMDYRREAGISGPLFLGRDTHALSRPAWETTLAGDPIEQVMTQAPGNGAAIGGLKVTTANGWFAARPSGTEALYKLYAESFKSEAHLDDLLCDAQELLDTTL